MIARRIVYRGVWSENNSYPTLGAHMFWRPKTRTEWALVVGIAVATLAWILQGALHGAWTLGSDSNRWGISGPLRLPDVVIVLLWLVYGFLRVQVRKRQSGVG